jgi:hypothetical protein
MKSLVIFFAVLFVGFAFGQDSEAVDAQRCTEVEACARCEGASRELLTCRREALRQADIQLRREWEENFRNELRIIEEELQEREEERWQDREEIAKEWEEKQRVKAKEAGIQQYGSREAWEEAKAKHEARQRQIKIGWFVLFAGLILGVIWMVRRTPYYFS